MLHLLSPRTIGNRLLAAGLRSRVPTTHSSGFMVWRATQRALRGVQQLPWPARSPDLSPIEHVCEMLQRELTLSPEPAATIAELRQWVQDAWDNLSQDDIRHLYDRLHARIHACVAARVRYTEYLCDCSGTPYCDVCFLSFVLNLLSYILTMINYLSHQFSIQ